MYIPPKSQGQIIDVSYGTNGAGTVYRRTVNHSTQSERWECAEYTDLLPQCRHTCECECWEPWNVEPKGDPDAWLTCEEPHKPRGER